MPTPTRSTRQRAAASLRELSAGCAGDDRVLEITREWREYERTSTAVLNAYVQPVASAYLRSLDARACATPESTRRSYVMKSNGGTADVRASLEAQPIHLVESGPVGGVIGAAAIGEAIGDAEPDHARHRRHHRQVLAASTTVRSRSPPTTASSATHGTPATRSRSPVVDIVEIGAGGGSDRLDRRRRRAQGRSQSAGAVPGPACYGQGGTEPTVTDANLIAGRINPDYFLGGEIAVSVDLARQAMAADRRGARRVGRGGGARRDPASPTRT